MTQSTDKRNILQKKLFDFEVISNGKIIITEFLEADNPEITEVEIPEKIDGKLVTSIGMSAFYECSNLTGITIPNRVTSIGKCHLEIASA